MSAFEMRRFNSPRPLRLTATIILALVTAACLILSLFLAVMFFITASAWELLVFGPIWILLGVWMGRRYVRKANRLFHYWAPTPPATIR
jgi:hypothetical protein